MESHSSAVSTAAELDARPSIAAKLAMFAKAQLEYGAQIRGARLAPNAATNA